MLTAYGIGVQGVKWDGDDGYMGFAKAWLAEAVRALQPGGALLYFASPCTTWSSRINVMLEDQLGLKHQQTLSWVYGQGKLSDSNPHTLHTLCIIRQLWRMRRR